ncbi:NAD(P)-dependent alcohol dehydrogenase [Chondrinema litorale]|uniref:NAD(P)-dependent alcohol dehydrogenase n=1 Tax=Chondrinema litorale TaxID=2994555 RepID=UPI0025433580|nr:NAD(P)-dependent alcohol dehydrogenase [Chondrinema litorale]UZR97678.1 NAD(P)-dependent alcohol dehydrogenase [Chondrinema litorale]
MKAVICTKYGAPEVLQIREVPKPIPRPNEILIKIKSTTVTVADFRVRSFTIPLIFWLPARLMLGISKPRKPILGVELSGVIEALGDQVKNFQQGDEVFAATLNEFGAYAEYICLAETKTIALKPAQLSFNEAAAIPIGARTALHYLKKANLKPGEKTLIYGASGSVGSYAVQLAKYFGAEVTGVCSNKNKGLIKSLGADKVIAYDQATFLNQLEMYDVIFIAVDKWAFKECSKFLKKGGTYINITQPIKSPKMIWASFTKNFKFLMGENVDESAESLTWLANLAVQRKLNPVIDKVYKLDEIREAHGYVESGHKKGNIVIEVG